MGKLLELLQESVIVQGLLALGVVGASLYMMIGGQEVPRDLWVLDGLILGFYFGSKVENAKLRRIGR